MERLRIASPPVCQSTQLTQQLLPQVGQVGVVSMFATYCHVRILDICTLRLLERQRAGLPQCGGWDGWLATFPC